MGRSVADCALVLAAIAGRDPRDNYTLSQPTFTLFPTADPVADWEALYKAAGSESSLKNHATANIATAHWPQEEKPEQFNAILTRFLTKIQW